MVRCGPTRDPHTRPAINTLERLHMELGGQILENRQKHAELSEQMRRVEAVIKLLDPGYNLGLIAAKRRKPNKWFKRGTLYRRAVDALGVSGGPIPLAPRRRAGFSPCRRTAFIGTAALVVVSYADTNGVRLYQNERSAAFIRPSMQAHSPRSG